MKLIIITGASRGLGKEMLGLLDKDNTVINVSKSSTDHSCDLSDIDSIKNVFDKIFGEVDLKNFTDAILINNAGVIEPIGPIGGVSPEKVMSHLSINVGAPMIAANEFLAKLGDYTGRIKVVNISSGVAQNPKAFWAVYSAGKAAIENFSVCLSKEVENRGEVFCVNPGLVDTGMQKQIRSASAEDFPEVERFKKFQTDGDLVSPKIAAKNVLIEAQILN